MTVLNRRTLEKFAKKHRDSATAIDNWLDTVIAATWFSIVDIRRTFPSADGVPVKVKGQGTVIATVFNLKGNEYRIISVVDFTSSALVIREVLTHAEYDKDAWKDRL